MNVDAVLARRQAEREALLGRARRFAEDLDSSLGVRAVVVFGSVARGDFNRWSDIDVLVVADRLPERALERLDLLPPWPGRVQPVAWTPAEFAHNVARGNPIAVEAAECGVWLRGEPPAGG